MFFFFDFDMNNRSERTFYFCLRVSFICLKSRVLSRKIRILFTIIQRFKWAPIFKFCQLFLETLTFYFLTTLKSKDEKKEIVGRHSWNIWTNEENYFTSSLTLWKAVWNRAKTSVRIGHIDVLSEMDPACFNVISCKFQTVIAVVFLWTMYPHCLNFKTSADDITIMGKTHSWWWLCLVRILSTNLALPFACMHKYDIKIVQICQMVV